MGTIRGRLTAWYATALGLTLAVFGVVIYLAGRRAAYQELARRLHSEAAVTTGILAETYRAGKVVVRARPPLEPEVAAPLQALPGFVIVRHRDGRVLFLSPGARALTIQQIERLTQVMDGGTAPPETLPVIEDTLAEINRMTELVDALLTLARADEGRADLHREAVDLRAVVDEVRETGELLAEHGGVTMEVATPAGPVVLPVDRSRIRELILNLVENAVKYTPRGGSVRLQLGTADGRVLLSVADTGIGVAPGDLPHIFDRFWRADGARTRTGERTGTGLGLAICKWIAEAHGGSIDVQSRPGRGTTFTVILPAHPGVTPGTAV